MPVKAHKSVKTWIGSFSLEAEIKNRIKLLVLVGEFLSYSDFVREALRDFKRHPYPIVPVYRYGHGSRWTEPLKNLEITVAQQQKALIDSWDLLLCDQRHNSHSINTVSSYLRTVVTNFVCKEYPQAPAPIVETVVKTMTLTKVADPIPADVLEHIHGMAVWKR